MLLFFFLHRELELTRVALGSWEVMNKSYDSICDYFLFNFWFPAFQSIVGAALFLSPSFLLCMSMFFMWPSFSSSSGEMKIAHQKWKSTPILPCQTVECYVWSHNWKCDWGAQNGSRTEWVVKCGIRRGLSGLELSERLSGFDVKWMTIVVKFRKMSHRMCVCNMWSALFELLQIGFRCRRDARAFEGKFHFTRLAFSASWFMIISGKLLDDLNCLAAPTHQQVFNFSCLRVMNKIQLMR